MLQASASVNTFVTGFKFKIFQSRIRSLYYLKVIPQYCIADPSCVRFSRHQREQISACMYTTKEISLKLDSEINARFLLNEHGDLYFFIAQ